MSTIAIVRKGSRAAIASDSLFSHGSVKVPPKNKTNHWKIHRFQDAFIGFTGWSAFHTIFECVIERYPKDLDFRSRKHIFETFQKLHRRLKKDFHLETQENDDQPVESSQWNCLIAAPAGIFQVESYREVYEYSSFWADGSGANFARGAMHALYDRLDDPAEIARAGVEAGCEFDDASGPPVAVHTVELHPIARSVSTRGRKKSTPADI